MTSTLFSSRGIKIMSIEACAVLQTVEEVDEEPRAAKPAPGQKTCEVPPSGRPNGFPECGKTFSRQSVLKKHAYTHTGETPCRCHICEKGFTHRKSTEHYFCPQGSKKRHRVAQRGQQSPDDRSLKVNRLKRAREKRHECLECGKKFSARSYLNTHMLVHTGERPHECQQCGRKFSQLGTMNRHMRTHTGERPYECQQCGKKFALNGGLLRHTRSHTGEKPYECCYCPKKYTRSNNLRAHMSSHREKKNVENNICLTKLPSWSSARSHQGEVHSATRPEEVGDRNAEADGARRNFVWWEEVTSVEA